MWRNSGRNSPSISRQERPSSGTNRQVESIVAISKCNRRLVATRQEPRVQRDCGRRVSSLPSFTCSGHSSLNIISGKCNAARKAYTDPIMSRHAYNPFEHAFCCIRSTICCVPASFLSRSLVVRVASRQVPSTAQVAGWVHVLKFHPA